MILPVVKANNKIAVSGHLFLGCSRAWIFSHTEDLIRESYEDDVYQNPEVYLDESLRMLSSKQKDEIKNLKFRIESLNEEKNRLEIFSDEIEDEDRLNNLNERIDDIENVIDDLNDEIESIEEDPEDDIVTGKQIGRAHV